MEAFTCIPPVVFSRQNDIDLFKIILAHIGGPQRARELVERKSPGITKSVGPDFGPSEIWRLRKGIPFRDLITIFGGINA